MLIFQEKKLKEGLYILSAIYTKFGAPTSWCLDVRKKNMNLKRAL